MVQSTGGQRNYIQSIHPTCVNGLVSLWFYSRKMGHIPKSGLNGKEESGAKRLCRQVTPTGCCRTDQCRASNPLTIIKKDIKQEHGKQDNTI